MPVENPPRKKPISAKQLAANRANARKSTGPRRASAKSIVRLNGLKHGLSTRTAVISDEEQSAHREFCALLIAECAPADAAEFELAQSIASDCWRLNRARTLEQNMLALGHFNAENQNDAAPDRDEAMHQALSDARTFIDHAGQFGLLTLYEQRIHRAIHKNRELLRRQQSERRLAQLARLEELRMALENASPGPQANAVNALPTETPPNGFGYANSFLEPETAAETSRALVAV